MVRPIINNFCNKGFFPTFVANIFPITKWMLNFSEF